MLLALATQGRLSCRDLDAHQSVQYQPLHNIARDAIACDLTALIETTARSPVPWVTMIEETGGGW